MINRKVVIRKRMSMEDAHYAGELVNGSKMLDFFGDIATELLIRLDGDEGLFRSYTEVDFLAPTFAGDFIEFTGWIERIGNTSRTIRFNAYKVIELVRDENLSASAANVLEEPVLVCTAAGVCITPKANQRGDYSKYTK